MRVGSVCSGIGTDALAWHPLGWETSFFAEIEPHCCKVLEHRFPDVPNLGDFTKIAREGGTDAPGPIDLLAGGTPCQSFSVAGLREGLDDPRGNLALEFLALADRLRPRWVVWENVPGVLSSVSNDAPDPDPPPPPLDMERDGQEVETEDEHEAEEIHAFNSFLAALSELGYGFSSRVLNAEYFGVPQRRRRVVLICYLGDWRPACAVLVERQSLLRNPPPSREEGPAVAALTESGVGTCGADDNQGQAGHLIPHVAPQVFGGNDTRGDLDVAPACNAKGGSGRMDFESEALIVEGDSAASTPKLPRLRAGCGRGGETAIMQCHGSNVGPMGALRGGNGNETGGVPFVAHALTGEGFDASEDGASRGTPLVPVALQPNQDPDVVVDGSPPVTSSKGGSPVVAFTSKDSGGDAADDLAPTLRAMPHHGSHANAGGPPAIAIRTDQTGSNGLGLSDDLAHALDGAAPDAIAFDSTQIIHPENRSNPQLGDPAPTVSEQGHPPSIAYSTKLHNTKSNQAGKFYKEYPPGLQGQSPPPAIAFTERTRAEGRTLESQEEEAYALTNPGSGGRTHSRQLMDTRMQVRRLTPKECERLQGLPDGWTLVPNYGSRRARKKHEIVEMATYLGLQPVLVEREGFTPDGPRYKAIGNGWAKPVFTWVGERIQMVEDLLKELEASDAGS